MKVGIDCDGVLAAFVPAYQNLCIRLTGKNLFHAGDRSDPPVWHWPQLRGYTPEEMDKVWSAIKTDPAFWLNLGDLDGLNDLRRVYRTLCRDHEVYFITARVGESAKWQTEAWLHLRLMHEVWETPGTPTVLISSQKGLCCKALDLDVYVDDNMDNVRDCVKTARNTRTYLLDRAYNQVGLGNDWWPTIESRRVQTLREMFDREGIT